jgi:hypothetical protein
MRRTIRTTALTGILVAAAMVSSGRPVAGTNGEPAGRLKIVRLYGDANGDTHLQTLELALEQPGGRSPVLRGPGSMQFARFAADLSASWHTTDRRKYLVTLSGAGYEIEASDGTKIAFPMGSILLADDMKSKGHRTKGLGTESLIMFVDTDDLPR